LEKVFERSDSEYYTPLSEPFRLPGRRYRIVGGLPSMQGEVQNDETKIKYCRMINLPRIRNICKEMWKEMNIKISEKEDKNGQKRNG
jgi:hypothetical protein